MFQTPTCRRRQQRAAAVITLTLLFAVPAAADTWTFTALPDPSPPYYAWGTPAHGATGEVVFMTWLDSGQQAIVALSAAGPRLVALADGAPFVSFTGVGGMQLENQPDLDDRGRVVFRAYRYEPIGMQYVAAAYLDDHGALTPLTAEPGGAGPWLDWCNPSLSGDGTCALFTWDTLGVVQTLWAGQAPLLQPILDSSGPLVSFDAVAVAADGGLVACLAGDQDGDQRLLVCAEGGTTLVSARERDGFLYYNGDRSVNRHGQVAFRAQTGEWTEAILVGDGGPLTTLAQSGGEDFFSFQSPGIDDQGRVVFQAQLMSWSDAILTGPDPEADRVIAEQDSLFGSVIWGLELGPRGVNAAGDIAFRYSLDDGREGIAIARRSGGSAVPLPGASRLALRCAPNPFNPLTEIAFTLQQPGGARVGVYGLDGREVVVLADRSFADGRQVVTWDGRDALGRGLPSGTYVVRVETAAGKATVKVQLVR